MILKLFSFVLRYIKLETTGKSVPGVKTKILSSKNDEVTKTPMLEGGFSPDIGEIAGWGRNVFMGYLNKENETKEVMTEGNFCPVLDFLLNHFSSIFLQYFFSKFFQLLFFFSFFNIFFR